MTVELYKDQFTPWIPNHWAGDGKISSDTFGGAMIGNLKMGSAEGVTSTFNLLYSSIVTNFYLGLFAKYSVEPEEE